MYVTWSLTRSLGLHNQRATDRRDVGDFSGMSTPQKRINMWQIYLESRATPSESKENTKPGSGSFHRGPAYIPPTAAAIFGHTCGVV